MRPFIAIALLSLCSLSIAQEHTLSVSECRAKYSHFIQELESKTLDTLPITELNSKVRVMMSCSKVAASDDDPYHDGLYIERWNHGSGTT
jgi:hypothetical protein